MQDGHGIVGSGIVANFWAERARKTIEEQYKTIESVVSLCHLSGVSPKQMREAFFFAYRTTPKRYLDEVRIHKAEGLLTGSKMKICEVAIESGFQSVSAFERTFVRIAGVCPSKFRNEALSGTGDESVVRKRGAKTPTPG